MFHRAIVLLIAIFAGFATYKNSLFLRSALMHPIISPVRFRILNHLLQCVCWFLVYKVYPKNKYKKWKHYLLFWFQVWFWIWYDFFIFFNFFGFEQCLCLYCCFSFVSVFHTTLSCVVWCVDGWSGDPFSTFPPATLIGTCFVFSFPSYCYSSLCLRPRAQFNS